MLVKINMFSVDDRITSDIKSDQDVIALNWMSLIRYAPENKIRRNIRLKLKIRKQDYHFTFMRMNDFPWNNYKGCPSQFRLAKYLNKNVWKMFRNLQHLYTCLSLTHTHTYIDLYIC